MKKVKDTIPSINLKGGDFIHVVPDEQKMEIIIHWKGKGGESEWINPIHSFEVAGDKLKITNRNLLNVAYVYNIKELKRAYLVPADI